MKISHYTLAIFFATLGCFAGIFYWHHSTHALHIWPSPTFPKNIDFYASVNTPHMAFGIVSPNDEQWYHFFADLYKKNMPAKIHQHKAPLIPKIIHQIWLGGQPPHYLYEFQKGWKQHHPDWEYKLWRDEDVKDMPMTNRELFDAAPNYGQKADILRYHILYEQGGIYADCDFECLLPFDLLHHCYDFYTGLNNCGDVELANGLIGASPRHPIIKACLDGLAPLNEEFKNNKLKVGDDIRKRFGDIISQTGPAFFTKRFMEVAPTYKGPIIVLPCSYFYPLPATRRNLPFEQMRNFIKPESFAIHYWACSWMRPEAFIVHDAQKT